MTPPPPARPLLLAVDGDGLMHRAYHATAGNDQRDGGAGGQDRRDGERRDGERETAGLRRLIGLIAAAAGRTQPNALVVGFDCREAAVRKVEYPGYKAHRADKHPDLAEQLMRAPALLREAGWCVASALGYEADDVLASAAARAGREGWRTVVVTSDRDSFALIDEQTSVLWLGAAGVHESPMITAPGLLGRYGVHPHQYRDFAALRGDPSDNLPGPFGIGATRAARLLAAFADADTVLAALDDERRTQVADLIGPAATERLSEAGSRDQVRLNQRLMTMRRDLPLPESAAMQLPIDARRTEAALARFGIHPPGGLVALTGASVIPPGPEELAGARARLRALQRPPRGRRPVAICEDQLSLF